MASSHRHASDPFRQAAAVTPSDVTILPYESLLYIGSGGDLRVDLAGGGSVTLKNHPAGYVPGYVTRVYATGTTAGNIVALW